MPPARIEINAARSRPRPSPACVLLPLFLTVAMTGCGNKGPLYLPDEPPRAAAEAVTPEPADSRSPAAEKDPEGEGPDREKDDGES